MRVILKGQGSIFKTNKTNVILTKREGVKKSKESKVILIKKGLNYIYFRVKDSLSVRSYGDRLNFIGYLPKKLLVPG